MMHTIDRVTCANRKPINICKISESRHFLYRKLVSIGQNYFENMFTEFVGGKLLEPNIITRPVRHPETVLERQPLSTMNYGLCL
jgi:hypothetical protein